MIAADYLETSVCATSIIRVHMTVTTNWTKSHVTWDSIGVNLWSTVESSCSIIAACLPTMRPLITRAQQFTSSNAEKRLRSGNSATKKVIRQLRYCHYSRKAVLCPRGLGGHFWNPPPPSRSSNQKGPYASIDEDDDLESGRNMYPMENMEAALTHGPNDTYQSPPRKPHPVLKSPKYQQDRLNAPPMSSPEFFFKPMVV